MTIEDPESDTIVARFVYDEKKDELKSSLSSLSNNLDTGIILSISV